MHNCAIIPSTTFSNTCANTDSNTIFTRIMVAGQIGEVYYCCPSQINDNYGVLKDSECDPDKLRSCRYLDEGPPEDYEGAPSSPSAAMAANPTAKECARAMGRKNEEKCESMACCSYDPNSEMCLVRSELAVCNPSPREEVEKNVECSCKIVIAGSHRSTFPCLPNVGCDIWWGIFVVCFIIVCVFWWWRCRGGRQCSGAAGAEANIRGGSQCSQCGNHLVAGAQFCPQCNGRTDALEPIPDLGGGWPGDSAGSPAPAMPNPMPAQSFRHTCSNVSYPP
jgi:hypothetical protein